MSKAKNVLIIVLFYFFSIPIFCQQSQLYKPVVNRVLFVLDVSGSMNERWDKKTKYETAKQLLFQLTDSVEKKNPNVEFAVRGFGYQFSKTEKNCTDSKLIVPFAKNNAAKIKQALEQIKPQGMTPIAYSLSEAIYDFPKDERSLNSVIIITDGNENCGGNPCSVSQKLLDKKISLRPFVIGLNAGSSFTEKLNCVGAVLDTKNESDLYQNIGVIIRQTLNTTTTQINLLDANSSPTVTNIPFSLYDHSTGKVLYNFVHTLNEKGNPDTLYLDPVGVYDLEVHTYPSIRKEAIELVPGKHNIIAVDIPFADFKTSCTAASVASNPAQVLVRIKDGSQSILNVQDLNKEEKYLSSTYTLEILTTPEILCDTNFVAYSQTLLSVPNYGTLSLMSEQKLSASIYCSNNNLLQMVDRFDLLTKTENKKLQPGKYFLVFKAKASYESESTRTKTFTIVEGQTVVLNLNEQ